MKQVTHTAPTAREDGPLAPIELTVVSCNTLLDAPTHAYAPQFQRLKGIVDAVKPLNPDVVSLYEVQGGVFDHPGLSVSESLGLSTHAFDTYGIRANEGILTAATDTFTKIECLPLDPDDMNRVAHIAHTAETGPLVVGTHPSHYVLKGIALRRKQMTTLLTELGTAPAVIMGDHNAFPWQQSRRMLKEHGFTSALESLGHPATFPTNAETCDIGAPKLGQYALRAIFRRLGVSLDDIYVRGGQILQAGLVQPPHYPELSDHYGVWARLRFGNTRYASCP